MFRSFALHRLSLALSLCLSLCIALWFAVCHLLFAIRRRCDPQSRSTDINRCFFLSGLLLASCMPYPFRQLMPRGRFTLSCSLPQRAPR
ncbi:hypothetical protein EDC01DRAFT_699530, partial [Geopyxis carbonaria]